MSAWNVARGLLAAAVQHIRRQMGSAFGTVGLLQLVWDSLAILVDSPIRCRLGGLLFGAAGRRSVFAVLFLTKRMHR